MRVTDFPADIQPHLFPQPSGDLVYRCLNCQERFTIESLLYTCPECKSVLLIEDLQWERLKEFSGSFWLAQPSHRE